jgi:hypothetical protein
MLASRPSLVEDARVATRSSSRDSEDLLAALYATLPAEFVAARDRVATELKQAGRAEEAARVKALKRPTASVWAVNQLARQESDGVAELLALGERVHGHERQVLRGGAAAGYLDDARLVRQRAAQLTRRAEALLTAAGLAASTAVGRRILQTLQAAALGDGDARAALAAGTLGDDLAPPASFGGATPDLANTLAASLASAKAKPTTKTASTGDRETTRAAPTARAPGRPERPASAVRTSHGSSDGARKGATAGERVAQRKQAVAARRQATADRKDAAAAARAQAAAERKQAAIEARAERAEQRRAEAAARKRIAAATRELTSAERAVATQRAAVERARVEVEEAEARLRASKDALAAAEATALAARRALDDASAGD